MRKYWSNSKFADWVRGCKKPKSATADQWDEWNTNEKATNRLRYLIAEEFLDGIQSAMYWPIDKLSKIKYYVNNRWVTRTHCLTAHPRDIKPGEWRDVGNRFLPCLFNELVEFVEIELAWWNIAWAKPEERKKYNPPFWATGWWRWRTWRSRDSGLDNLKWQMSLTNKEWCSEDDPDYDKPTAQAINAKEIYDLYIWWTEKRPKRIDPMVESGWIDYCGKQGAKSLVSDSEVDTRAMLDMMRDIEKKYEAEDEEMMIRLIRIRDSLWT